MPWQDLKCIQLIIIKIQIKQQTLKERSQKIHQTLKLRSCSCIIYFGFFGSSFIIIKQPVSKDDVMKALENVLLEYVNKRKKEIKSKSLRLISFIYQTNRFYKLSESRKKKKETADVACPLLFEILLIQKNLYKKNYQTKISFQTKSNYYKLNIKSRRSILILRHIKSF